MEIYMKYMHQLSALLVLSLGSTASLADTLGLHLGLGFWHSDPDGSLYDQRQDDLNLKSADNHYFYAAFEHPVPLLPNILVHYSDLSHKGHTEYASINGPIPVNSRTDLSTLDAVGYYELLDNWISIDLGVGLRRYSGNAKIVVDGVSSNRNSVDNYLPTLYLDGNVDLPFTGLSAGARFQGGSYDNTEFTEYSARLSYMLDSLPSVGAELGYKKHKLSRLNDADIDAEYTGPFLTLKVHF
jgi:outer membrane protein